MTQPNQIESTKQTVVTCYPEFSDPNFNDEFKLITFDGTRTDFLKQFIAAYENHPIYTPSENDLQYITICSNLTVFDHLKLLDALLNFDQIYNFDYLSEAYNYITSEHFIDYDKYTFTN